MITEIQARFESQASSPIRPQVNFAESKDQALKLPSYSMLGRVGSLRRGVHAGHPAKFQGIIEQNDPFQVGELMIIWHMFPP
jgi:hypothetical protein